MDSVRLVKGDIFQGGSLPGRETARVVELRQESIDNSAGGLTIHARPFFLPSQSIPSILP